MQTVQTVQTLQAPRERLRSIDRLRGLATLVMLEVHVVNALLSPAWRTGKGYRALNFVNGLVAPAFLFCAGFALALTLRKRWGSLTWDEVLRASLRRGAYLLLVGYGLHSFSMAWEGPANQAAWTELRKADILQVIGLSLTFLGALACVLRRPLRFALCALVIGTLVIVSTPFVRGLDLSGWPAWVQPYFTDRVPSQFPLFPWAGFALLGAALSSLPARSLTRRLGLAAVTSAGAAGLLWLLSTEFYPPHDPYGAGPAYMLLRFAVVCLLGALLSYWQDGRLQQRLDPLLLPFSRHSLLVYVAHIPMVYGGVGISLRSRIGATQGPLGCAFWVLALALLMYVLVRRADAVRRPQPRSATAG